MDEAKGVTRSSFEDSIRALYSEVHVTIDLVVSKQVWGIGKRGLQEIVDFITKQQVLSEHLYNESFVVRGAEIRVTGSLSDKADANICIEIDVIYSNQDAHRFRYKRC